MLHAGVTCQPPNNTKPPSVWTDETHVAKMEKHMAQADCGKCNEYIGYDKTLHLLMIERLLLKATNTLAGN